MKPDNRAAPYVEWAKAQRALAYAIRGKACASDRAMKAYRLWAAWDAYRRWLDSVRQSFEFHTGGKHV